MRFIARNEASVLDKRFQREISECQTAKAILYEDGVGPRDYARAGQAIAASAGRFSEAIVLFRWALSGDGWDERSTPDATWGPYRSWRAAQGEHRRLYDAPGHQFDPDEVTLFSQTIAFALQLGWDAIVAASPKRQLMLLSHDYFLEVYRGFGGGSLVRHLAGLGHWRKADLPGTQRPELRRSRRMP